MQELNATLVCGGYDEDVINGGPCALASRLDPVSQQWTAVTDMPGGRAGHAAVLLSNGRLLVTGGRGYDGHHSTAWMYDPAADAWASVAEMPSKRIGFLAGIRRRLRRRKMNRHSSRAQTYAGRSAGRLRGPRARASRG